MLTLSSVFLKVISIVEKLLGKPWCQMQLSLPYWKVVWSRVSGELKLCMSENSEIKWEENIWIPILLGHTICWKSLKAVNLLPGKIPIHIKVFRLFQRVHRPLDAPWNVGPHIKCSLFSYSYESSALLIWQLCLAGTWGFLSWHTHSRAGS